MSKAMPEWKRNLYLLVLGQTVFRISISFITPFLPFFVMELGISDLPAVALWTGAISSANHLTQTLSSPLWGGLADRYGRKAMVIRATLSSGIFTVLMATSSSVYQLFFFRVILGLTSGYHASAVTFIATQTPQQHLGYALGLLQTGQMVGTLLGPVIGGATAYFVGYRNSFIVSGLLKVTVAIPLILLLTENFTVVKKAGESAVKEVFRGLSQGFKVIAGSGRMIGVLFLVVLSGFAIRSLEPVMGLFVEQVYSGKYLNLLVSVVFSVVAFSNVIFSPVFGKLGDEKGYYKILVFCFLSTALVSWPHVLVVGSLQLIILRFIWGGTSSGILPLLKASVSKMAPHENKGAVYGILAAAVSFGNFLGALGGGALVSIFGFDFLFVCITVVFAVSGFLTIRLGRKEESQPQFSQLSE